MPLVSEIDPCRFRQAHVVHSAVLEEAPVFDGQDGINHDFGDVLVLDDLALRPLFGIEQCCD